MNLISLLGWFGHPVSGGLRGSAATMHGKAVEALVSLSTSGHPSTTAA